MKTRKFWIEALERASKSAAQAVIGLIPLDQFDVLHMDVKLAVSVAVGAAVLSVLTSIVTAPAGPDDSPSAV